MEKGDRPLWFAGVCDSLLGKLKAWQDYYETGIPSKGRDFLDYDGKVVNKVTQRAHLISFSKQEIDNWRVLFSYYSTNEALCREVMMVCDKWQTNGKIVAKGMKQVMLNFYPEHVSEIYQTINKAKIESRMGASIDELVKESQTSGKDLFEV